MRATDVKKVISMKVSDILVLIEKGFSSENNLYERTIHDAGKKLAEPAHEIGGSSIPWRANV